MQTGSRDSFIAPWKVYLGGMSRCWLSVQWQGVRGRGTPWPREEKTPCVPGRDFVPHAWWHGKGRWAGEVAQRQDLREFWCSPGDSDTRQQETELETGKERASLE